LKNAEIEPKIRNSKSIDFENYLSRTSCRELTEI